MISRLNFYNNSIYSARFRGNNSAVRPAENKTEPKKSANASIFYINDLHGNINNMSRIYNAKNTYNELNHKNQDVLCLASGDIAASRNKNLIKISNKFLNSINLDANTLGNHEFDADPQEIYDLNKSANYKILGLNMEYTSENNPLKLIVTKSYIKEINGNKYGIIGIIPPDLYERIRDNESKKTIIPYSYTETALAVQSEVEKLQRDGINKIILLSHCGLKFDKEIARNVSGIDVILGAHTHDLIKGIKLNENLVYSVSNEPVIITQAGKDGEYFGILNLEFDENGLIKSAQNNVQRTKNFEKNPVIEEVFNTILDKKEVVGKVKSALPPVADRLSTPNPHGYFIADACKSEFDTDIAMINAGNIRGHFKEGILTERKIYEVAPLNNKMVKMRINEEELVNAVKLGAESIGKIDGHRAGLVIPSGFEYTITSFGELKSLTFTDKNGNRKEININCPDKNKIYTLATDDFMACGGDNYLPNKLDEVDEIYDFDKDKLVADYVKKLGKPVEIVDDGRIKFVD